MKANRTREKKIPQKIHIQSEKSHYFHFLDIIMQSFGGNEIL